MHFVVGVPSKRSDGDQPDWLKSGCVLNWRPQTTTPNTKQRDLRYQVTLVIFEPPYTVFPKIVSLVGSQGWVAATRDPYILVAMIFAAWYRRIDENAWEVTNRGRVVEEVGLLALFLRIPWLDKRGLTRDVRRSSPRRKGSRRKRAEGRTLSL